MTLGRRSLLAWSLLALAPTQSLEPATQAREKKIRIEVANASNHRSIKDARVFVLSEQGMEIATATTDEHGIAWLPVLADDQHPKYLIVEHRAFFLSGMRWQAGLEDYYILTTILTIR